MQIFLFFRSQDIELYSLVHYDITHRANKEIFEISFSYRHTNVGFQRAHRFQFLSDVKLCWMKKARMVLLEPPRGGVN